MLAKSKFQNPNFKIQISNANAQWEIPDVKIASSALAVFAALVIYFHFDRINRILSLPE